MRTINLQIIDLVNEDKNGEFIKTISIEYIYFFLKKKRRKKSNTYTLTGKNRRKKKKKILNQLGIFVTIYL